MPEREEQQSEKLRRLEAIRKTMGETGHDFLIIYGTTGVGTPMNGNYTYASSHVPIYAASVMALAREGGEVLFVPGENQHLAAEAASWLDDVRLSPKPVDALCDHIAFIRPSLSNVGISSLAALPDAAAQTIRSRLDGVALHEAADLIFACRAVKSAPEQQYLRHATTIADRGLVRSIEYLRPGVSELDWKAECERVMTAMGADGGFNMISAGGVHGGDDTFKGYVISPTGRMFAKGDLALLEISPRFRGYYSQIVRLVSFGPVTDEIARAHDACIQAKNDALDALTPGTPFAHVAQAIETSLARSGHTMKDVAGAHTIGLDLSEQIITLSNPGTVAKGMVVTVHPMIDLGDGRQLFVGDTVLIGSKGPERLGEVRDEIVILD